MKKVLLLLMLAITSVGAFARDTYSRDESVLPVAAKTTLKKNFKAEVSMIKIDRELGRVSEYDVILTDGTEITFDRDGNWKDVEVSKSSKVPSEFVPEKIAGYVKKAQPNTRIVGIEKSKREYDVQLSNGVEMKFDKNGNFKRYDD